MTNGRSLETLTASDFLDVKGDRFELTEPWHQTAFQLELCEVTEVAQRNPGQLRQPFSVLFHGPLEPVLPQAIYRLEHDRLGVLELFIVPIGPDEPSGPETPSAAMRYEAVFS
jgi:hypothetical protein